MQSDYRFSLDIHKTVSRVSLNMKKGDSGRTLMVRLTQGGAPYHIPDGCKAELNAERFDGKQFHGDCSIENCVIIYEVSEEITSVVGRYTCEIVVTGPAVKRITSASFQIIVETIACDEETNMDPDKLHLADSISVDGAAVSTSFYLDSEGNFETKISMKAPVGEENGRAVVDSDTLLHLKAPAGDFGDAQPSDVVAGKTFTSAAGLKKTGTHQCSGGGSIYATDDGQGNVVVHMTGVSVVSDDGGNIVIA